MEIQQFQSIVGSFGHATGDEVLSEVARRLVTFEGRPDRVGVVVFPTDGGRAAELLQRADLALYRAKETGASVGVYMQGDDSSHRHRVAILGELRRAIASDELELHYQPKVMAATGQVAGCEALVRWRHPHKGFIPPGEFIAHAERTGAIRSLTAWVVATALRDLKSWQEAE